MRAVLVLAFVLTYAPPVLAQQPTPQPVEQVVVPTYTHESQCYQSVPCAREATCYAVVPCQVPCPPPVSALSLPCTPPASPQPALIHYEMRSKPLFWTGAITVAGGATLIVGSMTWAQASVPTSLPSLPCGTDPYFAQRRNIAPCETNRPMLAAGVSLMAGGALMMYLGSQHVAVAADGRHITVRVGF